MFFRLLLESFLRQRRRKALAAVAILLGTTAVTAMLALATTIGDHIHQELAVYGANIVVTPAADQLEVKVGNTTLKPATGNAYLKESDLAKLKTIFWANNITGISPELDTSAMASRRPDQPPIPVPIKGIWVDQQFGTLTTGAQQLHPWWKFTPSFEGRDFPWTTWHGDMTPVFLGASIARKLNLHEGDVFTLASKVIVDDSSSSGDAVVRGIVHTGDATDDTILMDIAIAQYLAGLPNAVSRVEIAARITGR